MKKCRVFLSMILSFLMLVSLIPGAAAVEIEEHFSFSARFEWKSLGSPIAVATHHKSLARIRVNSYSSMTVSAPDREYTLSNISERTDCYVVVNVTKYAATTAGEIRKQFKNDSRYAADLNALPDKSNTLVYFAESRGEEMRYLTFTGTWSNEIREGSDAQAYRVQRGQKVNFTLPEAEDNDIFRINFEYYFTGDNGTQVAGSSSTCVLVDTDGVYPSGSASVDPISDFDFPTYKQLPLTDPIPLTATYSEQSVPGSGHTSKTFLVTGSGITVTAPADQEYTVKNTGLREIVIKLQRFENKPVSELREKYRQNDVHWFNAEKLPEDDTLVPFCVNTIFNTFYLTTENEFKDGFYAESSRQILRVMPGETVTFRLPESQDGQYYRLIIAPDGATEVPFAIVIGKGTSNVSAFTDVLSTDYFADAVAWAVQEGITTGTTETTFSPKVDCTKAQILTFLWRANGCPEPSGENPFTDVPEDKYYRDAALWAYENGMVEGGAFDADMPCTRAMTVMYLWKLAGSPEAEPSSFRDVDAGADYATAVAWAVQEGITNGTSGSEFSPDMVCTRGQIVTLLHRALKK